MIVTDWEVLDEGNRANQFFKPRKNVDRLSQSIPNESSTEAVELHCAASVID